MSQLISPLVQTVSTRKDAPEVGDLLTVLLVKDGGLVESGARLESLRHGTALVKLVGLGVPTPYQVGDQIPLDFETRVADWE